MRDCARSKTIKKAALSSLVGVSQELEGLILGEQLDEAAMDLHNNAEGRRAASEGRAVNPLTLRVKTTYGGGDYS